MSGESIDQQLEKAHEELENGNRDEAVAILKPILATDAENVDAWWLYAHAVDDPETARMALNTVLRIDSNYPEAAELLGTLETQYPTAQPDTQSVQPPVSLPGLPEDEDIADSDEYSEFVDNLDQEFELGDEDFDDATEEAPAETRRKFPLLATALIALLLVVVVVLLLLFAPRDAQAPAATETVVADVPPTADAAALSISDETANVVTTALQAYDVPENDAVRLQNTSLGNTLIAGICSPSTSRDIQENIDAPMSDFANAVAELDEVSADAIGLAMTNCETDTVSRVIAVRIDDARAFANGTIDESTFSALWRAAG